jgi:hypothetical protein
MKAAGGLVGIAPPRRRGDRRAPWLHGLPPHLLLPRTPSQQAALNALTIAMMKVFLLLAAAVGVSAQKAEIEALEDKYVAA